MGCHSRKFEKDRIVEILVRRAWASGYLLGAGCGPGTMEYILVSCRW